MKGTQEQNSKLTELTAGSPDGQGAPEVGRFRRSLAEMSPQASVSDAAQT